MYEDRLERFNGAIGALYFDRVEVGHLFLETNTWTVTPSSGSELVDDFEVVAIDWEVRLYPTEGRPEEWTEGTISAPTSEKMDVRNAEFLQELESSRFILRAKTYEIRWVTDPEEKKSALARFR